MATLNYVYNLDVRAYLHSRDSGRAEPGSGFIFSADWGRAGSDFFFFRAETGMDYILPRGLHGTNFSDPGPARYKR